MQLVLQYKKTYLEHISLMAQEQIEIEFREELPKLAQMSQMMQQNMQNPNFNKKCECYKRK